MEAIFENKLTVGDGIYTVPDMAKILRLPYSKVNRWLNKYWDDRLGKEFQGQYSWRVESTRAVGFHTLVEFYVMVQFAEAGVKPNAVLRAHIELGKNFNTIYPFAKREIIENIKTDGKKIFFEYDGQSITLDGSKQLNLDFIKLFFKKLEFDDELLASKLWPVGKEKPIVCDPHHKFGQPTIVGTNIQTEVLYRLFKSNEPVDFIAGLYDLTEEEVQEAINFHNPIAA
ncbi:DUF433 domain-containing protein [Cognataquiflexum aquatile]|uniref:DUF433 domain-containing protein n=1 Tax=Cognataquiflexum aquatile TaxID=2249427 RepID=UPI000DE9256C|nr:DUF433 domain-containing protein [Cognataquiflexum aquatile]